MEYDIFKIVNMRNCYSELKSQLDNIVVVFRDKGDILEIDKMNKWLLEVINFYKKCGVKISYNDFYNFHLDNISDKDKRNEKINKYMEVFFRNMNNLDSYEFSKILFTFDDIDIDSINPIYEEIVVMINNFNNKHKSIFNKLLLELEKKYALLLGIDRELFRFERIIELKDLVDARIKVIDDKMSNLYGERQEEIKNKR